jgi:predicted Rossmann fold nucleotide-binding protein DprA/Smf involved in DNA uptake
MTYPTHSELSAVLAEVNGGEMSCKAIAGKLGMTIDAVAACALTLMEADRITCDDVLAPDMEDDTCTQ